jgi:hypothetical protein
MIASLQRRVPNREAKVVTNSVTNRMGNRGVLDNQNETREPGTLFIEGEDKCLGDGG